MAALVTRVRMIMAYLVARVYSLGRVDVESSVSVQMQQWGSRTRQVVYPLSVYRFNGARQVRL